MSAIAEYFIGAGDIWVAPLDANGNPTKWRDVGECPVVQFSPTAEYADNFATGKTGPNMQDLHVLIRRAASLALTLKERSAENLSLILHGEVVETPAGAVSVPVDLPSGIVAGDMILVPGGHVGITNLILHDAAAAVLVENTTYTFDSDSGIITFMDLAAHTQPFKVFSYDYLKSASVKVLSTTPPSLAVLFDGINLAVPGEKIHAVFDRIDFSPAAQHTLKAGGAGGTANEVDTFEITGVCQLKPGNEQNDGYGTMTTY